MAFKLISFQPGVHTILNLGEKYFYLLSTLKKTLSKLVLYLHYILLIKVQYRTGLLRVIFYGLLSSDTSDYLEIRSHVFTLFMDYCQVAI